jgi:hypothetical protein
VQVTFFFPTRALNLGSQAKKIWNSLSFTNATINKRNPIANKTQKREVWIKSLYVADKIVCFCVSKTFLKKFKIFLFFSLLQINIFLIFLDYFNALISKIIFKKYYFNTYSNKKYFKKQSELHF